MTDLNLLLGEISNCRICVTGTAKPLPHEPRPVIQTSATARIVIIGQAPGRKVHQSGVLWDDPSGKRLRSWLAIDDEQFYDPALVALVPMGFCYPGTGPSGDLPPRRECAPAWHDQVLSHLPDDRLEIIIGTYAQARYIKNPGKNLTETVQRWRDFLPRQVVLPHPSPRNQPWITRNPWFTTQTLPAIQARIREVLN